MSGPAHGHDHQAAGNDWAGHWRRNGCNGVQFETNFSARLLLQRMDHWWTRDL